MTNYFVYMIGNIRRLDAVKTSIVTPTTSLLAEYAAWPTRKRYLDGVFHTLLPT